VFVDAVELRGSAPREHDLCIVGGGTAGIALAQEFLGTSTDVCIVESGGFELEDAVQELSRGELDATDVWEDYLVKSRLRVFGGTTMAWGGLCRHLDDLDFEAKPWLEDYPGWPIGRRELDPYYDRAAAIVEVEPFSANYPERVPFVRPEVGLDALSFNFSAPVYPGAKYRDAFTEARTITVYLHANARELVPDPGGRHVRHLRVVTAGGAEVTIRARRYVLCAGGIEVPRILLNSDSVVPAGLGNGKDLVGRFFMSHYPHEGFGKAILVVEDAAPVMSALYERTTRYLALPERVRRTHRLLAAGFLLHPKMRYVFTGKHPGSMEKVLPEFESLLRGARSVRAFPVLVVSEQAPNRESRVVLTRERDPTGMRRVKLQFRRSPADVESLRRTVELVSRELGRHELGRLQTPFVDGSAPVLVPDQHHMGTTRMHPDPGKGVVDADGRVHGIDNLFVAGPSVFPSGGFAGPVFTILALALRLADHLKRSRA
jgi:choline dehydrogenase-like flavoprotein